MSGLDPVKFFGKDYAAEFKENTRASREELKRQQDEINLQQGLNGKANVTNPITAKAEEVEEIPQKHVQVPAEGAGAAPEKEALKGEVAKDETAKDEVVEEKPKERVLSDKNARKQAEKEATEAFMKNGTANGEKVDEKTAKKYAKNYVKNLQRKEEAEFTQTYIDKDAYKAAERERKQKEKELIEQYRAEGLSKKEAKKKAKAQLPHNEYVKNKKTREFMQNHKEEFFNEDGTFSSDKAKEFAVKSANAHTKEGEAKNYYLSLRERREVAETYHVKDDVISDIAHRTGVDFEKDYTELIQAGVIVGAAGLTFAAGQLFRVGSRAASSAAAGAGVAGAEAGAAAGAGATASVSGSLLTTPLGILVGEEVARRIKDPGNKEQSVYEPKKPYVEPEVQPETEPEVEPEIEPETEPEVEPEIEEDPCVPVPIEEDLCEHKVKKGDTWAQIVVAKYRHEDGTQLSPKEQKQVWQELKRKHGITNMNQNTIPETITLYTDLLGKTYKIECDNEVKKIKSKARPHRPYQRYTGHRQAPRSGILGCDGNETWYDSREARDAALQK